tara:strand:- start:219 stop:1217 length:999 start_codon:yes stop_codon:yes gene_type:complete
MDLYLSDIIVGLQNGFEGKTKVGINLLKNSFYDLCIKVNGGVKSTPIFFEGKEIFLKEIPYSILFGIKTLISNSCLINFKNLVDDIKTLKNLNISTNNLYISKNVQIIQAQHLSENRRNGLNDKYFSTYRDKYNKLGITVDEIDYLDMIKYLDNNIVTKIDTIDLITKSKKILLYQFYSFNYDIDWGLYNKSKSIHSNAGFCCTLVSPNLVNNIYGISSIYDICFENYDNIVCCDDLKKIENFENNICKDRTIFCNWLNLDNLLRSLKINNVSILIFTRCDVLINIHVYKLYHNNKLIEFKNWKEFNKYLGNEINKVCNLNEINYSCSKINL